MTYILYSLEMWRYDKELIMSTTQQEILDAVNNLNKSPWYGYSHDYTKILGGITRNASGHVTGARVAQVFWRLEIPDDVEVVHNQGSGLELQLARTGDLLLYNGTHQPG